MDTELGTAGQMTLMEHLTELRTRIVRSVIAIAIGAIVAYSFYGVILDFLMEPYCDRLGEAATDAECKLLAVGPTEGFSVRFTVAGYAGVGLAMPIVLWQAWQFIAPGLYPQEKRYGIAFVIAAFFLFACGAGLAYWTLPRALAFFEEIGTERFEYLYRPREYISLIVKMMVGFGVGFEFPIVLIFLQILGVIDNSMLRSGRRYAIVGIVALVAVLTPSGDPWSLMALSVPMYLFYEIAIAFGWWRKRRQSSASA